MIDLLKTGRLCLLVMLSLTAVALFAGAAGATMPARDDVFPQDLYDGMQVRNIVYEGVTISFFSAPPDVETMRHISGPMAGDVVRLKGEILYTAREKGEWKVVITQGDQTVIDGSEIDPEVLSENQTVSFDVSMPIDPDGAELEADISVWHGTGKNRSSILLKATFYNASTWAVKNQPTPTPEPGSFCPGAVMVPLLAVGLAGLRRKKGR